MHGGRRVSCISPLSSDKTGVYGMHQAGCVHIDVACLNEVRPCALQAVNPNNKQLAERADKVAELRSKVSEWFDDDLLTCCREAITAPTAVKSPRPSRVSARSSRRPAVPNMRHVLHILLYDDSVLYAGRVHGTSPAGRGAGDQSFPAAPGPRHPQDSRCVCCTLSRGLCLL